MAKPASSDGAEPDGCGPAAAPALVALRCLVALVLLMASGGVINGTIYAIMASFFAVGREITTCANALAFVLLAVVALRRPSLLDGRAITAGVAVTVVAGTLCTAAGISLRNPPLLLAGLLCRSVSSAWATGLFTVALSTLPTGRSVLLVTAGGAVLSRAAGLLIPAGCPVAAACAILAVCTIAPLALVQGIADPSLACIRQGGGIAMRDLKGFAPFAPLVLCMFLMAVASGYAIAFNQQNDAPVVNLVGDAIVAVVFVGLLAASPRKSEDLLFTLSVLLVVAGYLVAPYELVSAGGFANALLGAGRDCFHLLLWILLAFVGRRNLFMLLPVVGFVRAASSLGTDVGAVVGHATNRLIASDPQLASIVASVMLFGFVAVLWTSFRRFSFTDAVNEVRLVTSPEIEGIGSRIDDACRVLGKQCGLTPRETEILVLLAKGRDGKFVAEKYVLSYQTVKTHIKHLYAKLSIHSRQELISLVDQTQAAMAAGTAEERAEG